MSLFGKILSKLGLGKKPAETSTAAKPTAAPSKPVPTPTAKPATTSKPATPTAAPKPAQVGTEPVMAPKPTPISEVDVVKQLEGLAKGTGLNWKVSIVDLLKLLDLDSSKEARIELAKELGCPEDLIGGDYSKMNVWLHKTVLKKIAENGGNIPQELLD